MFGFYLVLIFGFDIDNLIDPSWAKEMASQAPHGRYREVTQAGNLFALDNAGRRLTLEPFI